MWTRCEAGLVSDSFICATLGGPNSRAEVAWLSIMLLPVASSSVAASVGEALYELRFPVAASQGLAAASIIASDFLSCCCVAMGD